MNRCHSLCWLHRAIPPFPVLQNSHMLLCNWAEQSNKSQQFFDFHRFICGSTCFKVSWDIYPSSSSPSTTQIWKRLAIYHAESVSDPSCYYVSIMLYRKQYSISFLKSFLQNVGFKFSFTHHLRVESCKGQSKLTSSLWRRPSCPLLLKTRNALPLGPSFLEASNSPPTYVTNFHSWYPFTMHFTWRFTFLFFSSAIVFVGWRCVLSGG